MSFNYAVAFNEAAARTQAWGLTAPQVTQTTDRALDESGTEALSHELDSLLGQLQPKDVSQQCFAITHYIKNQLEDALNTPLTFTLGYVEVNSKPIFFTPAEELRALIGTPAHIRPVNLHAWLTTPALEIIDTTFCTTYGVVGNDSRCIGRVIAQHHSQFNENMIYHPQIIGEDYLEKIGATLSISW